MKCALVTGAAGEIGFAICKTLKADGYHIIGTDLNLAQEDIFQFFFRGNVDDENLIKSVINQAVNYERIVLVNCAGVTYPNDFSLEGWNRTININLTAPYLWMLNLGSLFESNKYSGSILNITSLGAELAFPNNPAYAASKGGLKTLTKSFAMKLGNFGVTCNSLGPGYIKTKFNQQSLNNESAYKARSERTLLGRWGEPEDVASAAAFLVSEKASYITGQDFYVDGGWLAKGL